MISTVAPPRWCWWWSWGWSVASDRGGGAYGSGMFVGCGSLPRWYLAGLILIVDRQNHASLRVPCQLTRRKTSGRSGFDGHRGGSESPRRHPPTRATAPRPTGLSATHRDAVDGQGLERTRNSRLGEELQAPHQEIEAVCPGGGDVPNSCLPCRPPNDTAGGRAIPRDFAYIDGHLPDGDTLPLMRLATAAQLAAGLRPVP